MAETAPSPAPAPERPEIRTFNEVAEAEREGYVAFTKALGFEEAVAMWRIHSDNHANLAAAAVTVREERRIVLLRRAIAPVPDGDGGLSAAASGRRAMRAGLRFKVGMRFSTDPDRRPHITREITHILVRQPLSDSLVTYRRTGYGAAIERTQSWRLFREWVARKAVTRL